MYLLPLVVFRFYLFLLLAFSNLVLYTSLYCSMCLSCSGFVEILGSVHLEFSLNLEFFRYFCCTILCTSFCFLYSPDLFHFSTCCLFCCKRSNTDFFSYFVSFSICFFWVGNLGQCFSLTYKSSVRKQCHINIFMFLQLSRLSEQQSLATTRWVSLLEVVDHVTLCSGLQSYLPWSHKLTLQMAMNLKISPSYPQKGFVYLSKIRYFFLSWGERKKWCKLLYISFEIHCFRVPLLWGRHWWRLNPKVASQGQAGMQGPVTKILCKEIFGLPLIQKPHGHCPDK